MVFRFLKAGFDKIRSALTKTRAFLGQKIRSLFTKIDLSTIDQLEQILYEADLGVKTATDLTEKVKSHFLKHPRASSEELITFMQEEMVALFQDPTPTPSFATSPHIILIVGVNGNGKTTSIAKLAKFFKEQGKKPLVAAADTFRAAAIDQLDLWAKRIGVDIVKGAPKSDPAAVAFDALTAAKARQNDLVLIDTAGRLHTKTHLMQELEKVKRTCQKVLPDAPHDIWLVIDATTGQNGLEQAKTFHQFTPLTGLILTKLDGTAKGGILLRIQQELKLPIYYIGVGEGEDDLIPFEASQYIKALFE